MKKLDRYQPVGWPRGLGILAAALGAAFAPELAATAQTQSLWDSCRPRGGVVLEQPAWCDREPALQSIAHSFSGSMGNQQDYGADHSRLGELAQQPDLETMPAEDSPFENALWYLTSYRNDAGEQTSAETFVQPPAIRFSEGRVGGNATCNRFFGSYRLDGDALMIQPGGSTLMACPDAFMIQEQTVLTALGQVGRYAIANDELQLLDADGEVLLTFDKAISPALTGTLWQLLAYNNGQGGVVSILAGTNITATFDGNGGLTGFAGCNNYIASYDATADTIDIGSGVSTRKFCGQPEGLMDQETAYLQALEMAATYSIEGNTLTLTTADGATVAQFSAVDVAEER